MEYSFKKDRTVIVLRHTNVTPDIKYQWVLLCTSNLWCSDITDIGFKKESDALKWAGENRYKVMEHYSFLDMITYWADKDPEDWS